MTVEFRPRIGPWVMSAMFMTMVAYGVLRVFGPKFHELAYPFGLAALIGGGYLMWNMFVHGRKRGIVADEHGVTDVATDVTLKWDAITQIKLDIEQVKFQNGQFVMRVATLEAAGLDGGKSIRFADLGPGRPHRAGSIVNIETAGLLLALAAARTNATALYPKSWTETAEEPPPPPPEKEKLGVSRMGGLTATIVKAGPKVGTVIVKLFKTIKLGSVAIAVGAYALIFSWKFALALVGMVLFHECGHVFAMWRSGVAVKGIYFIPFFGGAAVSQGVAKTRARSAYIAINGPIWGTILAAVFFVVFAITHTPFLGTLAAWCALLNLFNLLPIYPLDGGRIVTSLASTRRSIPVVVTSLVLGAALSYFANMQLLQLLGIVGLIELGQRFAAATYAPTFALLTKPLTADDYEALTRHVAYVEIARDTPSKIEARKQVFTHRKAEAEQTPMSFKQGLVVLAGYLAVIGALVAILYLTTHVEGGGNPLSFLR